MVIWNLTNPGRFQKKWFCYLGNDTDKRINWIVYNILRQSSIRQNMLYMTKWFCHLRALQWNVVRCPFGIIPSVFIDFFSGFTLFARRRPTLKPDLIQQWSENLFGSPTLSDSILLHRPTEHVTYSTMRDQLCLIHVNLPSPLSAPTLPFNKLTLPCVQNFIKCMSCVFIVLSILCLFSGMTYST